MSAQILPPPAAGDPYDNPYPFERFQPVSPESRSSVAPFAGPVPAASGAVGRMGDPSSPTVPSERRRREGIRTHSGALRSGPPATPPPIVASGALRATAAAMPPSTFSGPIREDWPRASAPIMPNAAVAGMPTSMTERMRQSIAQSAPLRPAYPVAVASVPWASAPLAPFGGVALPATPPVQLTHSPAEPAESEPHITDDDYGYGIAHVVLPGCPHPFYTLLRQWTPAFVPSLEGALALALALALVFDSPVLRSNVAGFGGIYALFAIYLAGGALFGVALYFARSEAAWFATLVMGGLLLPALILSPVLGVAYAVSLLIGALVIGLLVLGIHRTEIGEGRAAVTKLFGRYFRVVRLDHFLRLPGERVVALLDASERVFTTPTVYAELDSPDGTGYRARATCTATYAILPSEAQRVVPVLATWEQDLEQQVLRALHEALTEWATHATITGSPPPRGTLARDVMSDVRHWAQRHGIWLMRVRVHNIWLQPLSDASWAPAGPLSASVALPRQSVSQNAYFSGSPTGPGSHPLPVSQSSSARPSSPPAAYAPPMSAPFAAAPSVTAQAADYQAADYQAADYQAAAHAPAPSTPHGSDPPSASSASTQALVAAYEEVREGRITHPQTIREIARAFRLAAEHPPADPFPYDGYAAARVLEEYAARLER